MTGWYVLLQFRCSRDAWIKFKRFKVEEDFVTMNLQVILDGFTLFDWRRGQVSKLSHRRHTVAAGHEGTIASGMVR